jgi:hypothetical protein
MDEHNARIKVIAQRVREFHDKGVPFRNYHGATNSTRILKKDADKVVDTSALNHVIAIDERSLTAIVEPNVAMDVLVDSLLPHGVIPRVVPEFPGITAGGSYSGTAAESSSFGEGYFDRTVNWVEIILADGDVVHLSRILCRSSILSVKMKAPSFSMLFSSHPTLVSSCKAVCPTHLPSNPPSASRGLQTNGSSSMLTPN